MSLKNAPWKILNHDTEVCEVKTYKLPKDEWAKYKKMPVKPKISNDFIINPKQKNKSGVV